MQQTLDRIKNSKTGKTLDCANKSVGKTLLYGVFFEPLLTDFRIIFERDPAARNWLEVLLCYPGLHALCLHRLAH